MSSQTRFAALKPRKTPAQSRSAATVDAIVEAAARILETKGLPGYTTNAISQRAGVSVGSLYQYFPGRDAITRSLVLRETSALLADVDRACGAVHGRAGIRALIAAAVAHQLKRPALARLIDLEEERLPLGAEAEHVEAHVRAAVGRLLCAPDLAGADHHPLMADDLVAIVKGMVDAAGQRGERDAEALCRRVERAVFGYLAAQDLNPAARGANSSAPIRTSPSG
jgi:AcrR family transcriptional regulator